MNSRVLAINATDVAFHHAAHFIAKVSHALLPDVNRLEDISMDWNLEKKRLEGPWLEGQIGEFRLAFDPIEYELRWENRNRILVDRMGLKETAISDVEAWWIKSTKSICGVDPSSEYVPFTESEDDHPGTIFPSLDAQSIIDWVQLRSRGEKLLLALNEYFQSSQTVKVWSDKFNSNIEGPINSQASLCAGIAISDRINRSPYFYIYVKIGTQNKVLPISEAHIGHWIEKPWSGFILPFEEYLANSTDDIQKVLTEAAEHILNA